MGRLEVAQCGVRLAEAGADGHAVARERSADGGDGAHREKVLRYVLRVQNWEFHALMGGISQGIPRFVGGH
jgi:hypothetical protein